MKKFKPYIFILFFASLQVNAQQSFTTSGGNSEGSGGIVSFSIGQPAYNSFTSSSGTLSEGVQQGFEIYSLSLKDTDPMFSLSVYPNPTSEYLTINFNDKIPETYNYKLFDITGKLIVEDQIISDTTHLDLSDCVSATYLLNLYNDSTKIQSFKILKN